ncbi:hypothetical protein [Streptacidiphilus fuscans]|uniref:Uncharacterized protein n=1 Tax=Streptacidiphilus fuscans TaxID=2789292 RepID=A0A931FBQ3_9ACTN|nr:hypothetical protein [Streptacidiphilus fuscans]MBF9067683.1 hypothetical protein [Streptacidiphilus fuscans]
MDDDSTLARLLAAAAAPAHPDELDGEEAALAAFRQQLAVRSPAGPWRSSPERASGRGAWRWSRVIPASAAVAVIATGVGLLGTQLSGAARPSRHTGVSVTVPASVPASLPAGRSPSARHPSAVAPTPTPSASPRQRPAASSSAVRNTTHGSGANSGKHNGSQGHGGGSKKSGKTGGSGNGGNGNGGYWNGQNSGKGNRGR